MKTWQHTGLLLVAIGLIHTLFAVIVFWPLVREMLDSGMINTVTDAPMSRFAVHWFMLAGYFWIVTGVLCHWVIRQTQAPLPSFFGILLIVFGLIAVGFQPLSGTWALVIFGALVVYWARKHSAANAH